jgi:acetoacetyl-CoA reductase/3-oxoacyl-[acyl-carrier protein] reductase
VATAAAAQGRILDGQSALVTGASRGIGRAIALALAEAGAAVMLTYERNQGLAAQAAEEVESRGGHAGTVQMSLESRQSIKAAVAKTKKTLGAVDILVNNAAVAQEKPFEEISDEDWDRVLACNLRGAFVSSQEVLPGMIEARCGRIINITSVGGQWGGLKQVHYAASKAGLISLTMSLARIFSDRGVTCNAVSPGLVVTDMASEAIESETRRGKIEDIPIKRVGTAREVADVVVFLASKAASYVTGQTINVNGGMYFG